MGLDDAFRMGIAMTRNQTISFLTRRFREKGIRPATRHGQNFLIDPNLQQLLVNRADLSPEDVVLEVGTGSGSLTLLLADRAAAVVTVEIDRHLHELARDELDDCRNVLLLQHDVLAGKNRIESRIMDAVRDAAVEHQARQWKLVANLPFNVATPVISNLLLPDDAPYSMTVTIQKELADRIVAEPSTKDYGALSLWIQSQCKAEIVRILPPSVFWPRPKVESAIIHLARDDDRRDAIPDRRYWHDFARAFFFHRRKYLRTVLQSAFKRRLRKDEVGQIIQQCQIVPTVRGEQLSMEQIFALCEAFRQRLPEWSL